MLWLWSTGAAFVALAHLLRVRGSRRWCRVLAGYLCLFLPLGTIFGVLVFVYLGTQKEWAEQF